MKKADSPGDDIRPRGTVEIECSECHWFFWVDALDMQLPDGPFVCVCCMSGPEPTYESIQQALADQAKYIRK